MEDVAKRKGILSKEEAVKEDDNLPSKEEAVKEEEAVKKEKAVKKENISNKEEVAHWHRLLEVLVFLSPGNMYPTFHAVYPCP